MLPGCLIAAFALAFGVSVIATPLVIRAARALNAIDAPDGSRKHQAKAVPLGGGLSLAAGAGMGVVVVFLCELFANGPANSLLVRGLLPAAVVLLIVGLIDDFIGLTGIYKLIGQVLAATLLAAGGAEFNVISLLGLDFYLGSFALAFSVFFILGAINAFNLVDGADGLAGSIGVVILLTLGTIAAGQGKFPAAAMSFATAGGLLGFLPYNWAPARIYLGDTGSMLTGLIVSYVAIDSMIKQQAAAALAVPVAVCAIPLFDVLAALVRRVTTGQSVFTPDRGHFHHALLLRGFSVRETAILAAGLTAITCGGALAGYRTQNDWIPLVTVAFVLGGLAGLGVFGHAEARLMASKARTGWSGLWRRVRRNAVVADQTDHSIAIQGSREWNDLWTALREAAPKFGIVALRLNINIPRLHEAYYGNWRHREQLLGAAVACSWRLTYPLTHNAEEIGKLTVEGRPGLNPLESLESLAGFLEPLADEVERILDELGPERRPGTVSTLRDHQDAVAAKPLVDAKPSVDSVSATHATL